MTYHWKNAIQSFDDRRDLIIPGDEKKTLEFCTEHFIALANESIEKTQKFAVALSGGTTPKAIFQLLANAKYRKEVDWTKVLLFWSDERCVPPSHRESNYLMAMDAGFNSLKIPEKNIFRMPADAEDLVKAAQNYEAIIYNHVPNGEFDLVMLGMGEDGHAASLFPQTHGLHIDDERLVTANFIPQKDVWRMTLTFECINNSKHIAIYVLGKSKAAMLAHVLTSPLDPNILPIQKIGTRTHKALWIIDEAAANNLLTK